MDAFKQYILQYTPLLNSEWEQIRSHLTMQDVPAGTTLLQEGALCHYLYFVEEGLLRFYRTQDGRTVSKFFTFAPYCFTEQQSFTRLVPSNNAIETLEPCRLYRMPRQAAFDLLDTLPHWASFIRQLLQEVQYNTEQLLEAFQYQTAEARYRQWLAEGSPLLERVPLQDLASFLGIAPASLSRIRKKLTLENQNLI